MKPVKFKPIEPDPQDVAALRRKLYELVRRMKNDYEKWLKPLVLKMSAEARERVSETNKEVKEIIGDAVRYFNAFEVARQLHVLKSKIEKACQSGEIKNTVFQNGEYLIPESSIREYGISIGKIDPEREVIDLFNERLEKLIQKYNNLIHTYQTMSEQFAEKMYQDAKKKFMRQFEKNVGIDVLKTLSEKGLRDAFDLQVSANVNLIKSIPQKYFSDIQNMVISSTTGGFQYEGGLQKAIEDLTGVSRTKAQLIARDQSQKAVSTFTRLRFQNLGSVKYIWRNSRDKRVAGNPSGLYPKVDPKSKYHGNHWKREGKVFEWKNPPPDGNPGEPINCRCYAEPIFDIDE